MIKRLLPLLLFILIGCSEPQPIDSNLIIKRDGIYYEKFSQEPFSGKVKGKISGLVINGKLENEVFFYQDDGQLLRIGNFLEGVPSGKWKFYDEDGDIVLDGILKGNNFVEYNENNQVSVTGTINENFNYDGEWLIYNDDGKVTFQSRWNDGNKLYYTNRQGGFRNKYYYNFGFKPLTFHSINPKKFSMWETYIDGKLSTRNIYFKSGELRSQLEWVDDNCNQLITYFKDGSVDSKLKSCIETRKLY